MRRGSVYLLVLAVGTVLSVIGLSMLSVSRAGAKSLSQSEDFMETRALAGSAIDHAMLAIASAPNWRSTYNGLTVTQNLGRGTFSWQVIDEVNGSLLTNPSAAYTICGTGSVNSASYSMRVHMQPQFTALSYGAVVSQTVLVQGAGTVIDSYDSTNGDYGGANTSSASAVATNYTAAGAITVKSGAAVKGSVAVGPGGNTATCVVKDGTSTITGNRTNLPSIVAIPVPAAPTNLGPITGSRSYQGNHTFTINSDMHLSSFEVKNNATVQVVGNVTIYVEGPVTISNNGTSIEIMPNSSLSLFFTGGLTISSGAITVVNGQNMSRLKFLNLGTTPVVLEDVSSAEGVIFSPKAAIQMSGGFQLYGALAAKSLSITTGAKLHEDKRVTTGTDPATVPTSATWDSYKRFVQ